MEAFAPRHLLMILVVVLLVFGTKKLRTVGSDLGAAVRDFKKSMRDGESQPAAVPVRVESGPGQQSEHRDA